MDCTNPKWVCQSSSMKDAPSNGTIWPIRSVDNPFEQGGQQCIDLEFMASSHLQECCRIARLNGRPWQKSLDSQEFGFASNLLESVEVAPADELFYKGQLLPLQLDPRLHLVQALSCEQGQGQVRNGGGSSMLLSWSRDEDVKFNSCRMQGVVVDKPSSSAITGLRSSSFRSHNSGYWESGGDKDTGDSSSSSRDSNGSSQDSYSPNTNNEAPCASHQPKVKANLSPWKSIFGGLKKASKRLNPHASISKVAFSEDLSKYKVGIDPPLKEAKEALLPLKVDKGVEHGSLQERQAVGGLKAGFKSKSSLNDKFKGGFKSKSAISDGFKDGGGKSKSSISNVLRNSFKAKIATNGEVEEKKQRSAAVKERWQGYAKKLKPLYELKRGLMGQFRMDECGKNACEVESGIILRSPLQRRLSHQSSLFKSHKLIIHRQDESSYPCTGNVLAMSSCPPSTRSSPNHSGVLAVVDSTPKGSLQGGGNLNNNISTNINTVVSSNYISISTMHELHSAVQSAIAHCKESNSKHHLA